MCRIGDTLGHRLNTYIFYNGQKAIIQPKTGHKIPFERSSTCYAHLAVKVKVKSANTNFWVYIFQSRKTGRATILPKLLCLQSTQHSAVTDKARSTQYLKTS